MAFNDILKNNVTPPGQTSTLTLNGVTAGNVVAGPKLLMSDVRIGTLSARCTVTAETNTLTLTAVWEVSADGSTWLRARGEANASEVALATGTAGADAAVTRSIDAPNAVYGFRYARCSILTGVATAGASDLAAVTYDYQQDQGA